MPMYSYGCLVCDRDFEKIVDLNSRDSVLCDKCGNRAIRKIDRPGLVWSPTRNGGHSTQCIIGEQNGYAKKEKQERTRSILV